METAAMTRRRLLARLAAVLLAAGLVPPVLAQETAPTPVTLDEAAYAGIVRKVIENHVQPTADVFADRAAALRDLLAEACATPGRAALATARGVFRDTATAHGALATLRYGPLLDDNRLERLAFWPDARGIGLRQVQGLLAARDPSATTPETLAAKSVAVQGLTAIEFLLFGTGAEVLGAAGEEGAYRCAFAAGAAANVATIARAVADGWRDPAVLALFEQPGPSNPVFQTSQEAAGEMLQSAGTALELIADHKLKPALGETAAKAKPRLAPYWRSEATMPVIAAELAAVAHLVEASGIADVLPADRRWLPKQIGFELLQAAGAASRLAGPMERLVADDKSRDLINYLMLTVRVVRVEVTSDLGAALGLAGGFNSLDGD